MKKLYTYIIIALIAIVSTFPILKVSNIYGHDSRFHLACITDIKENISLTNPFPKLTYNSEINLGYGTHLFYPPLPHYVGAYSYLILKNFNCTIFDALVFVYFIVSLLSGIAMYHLAYSMTKNKLVSILGSAIYLLMPYRMGNIIVRSAMNELFTFLFIPMILLSLNNLIENKKFLPLFVIGFSGLILSHLVISFYTAIFLIFWGIINFKKIFNKEISIEKVNNENVTKYYIRIDTIKKILLGILIVSIIVAPFLSLVISQKNGGNYLVFKENYMSGLNYMETYSISIKDFFVPKDDYSWDVPLFINTFVLINLFISILTLIKHKKFNSNIFYYIFLLVLCFVMCLNIFPWDAMPDIFYLIQFPWRLEIFISISISVLAPLWIINYNFKHKNIISIALILILIVSEIPFLKSFSTHKYLISTIDYSPGMGNMQEYLPVNTYNNLYYFNQRENEILYDGQYHYDAKLFENSEKLMFKINSTQTFTKVEIPRLYYIGYKLTNSKGENIEFYENEYGFIEFISENDTYTLEYVGPLAYRIFIIIRYLTIAIVTSYLIYNFAEKHRKK